MLAEVHYWRDMARVLEAIATELKQPFVELIVQILSCADLTPDVTNFQQQRSRVTKGVKEAKWNHKYMKILEKPVTAIESALDLK